MTSALGVGGSYLFFPPLCLLLFSTNVCIGQEFSDQCEYGYDLLHNRATFERIETQFEQQNSDCVQNGLVSESPKNVECFHYINVYGTTCENLGGQVCYQVFGVDYENGTLAEISKEVTTAACVPLRCGVDDIQSLATHDWEAMTCPSGATCAVTYQCFPVNNLYGMFVMVSVLACLALGVLMSRAACRHRAQMLRARTETRSRSSLSFALSNSMYIESLNTRGQYNGLPEVFPGSSSRRGSRTSNSIPMMHSNGTTSAIIFTLSSHGQAGRAGRTRVIELPELVGSRLEYFRRGAQVMEDSHHPDPAAAEVREARNALLASLPPGFPHPGLDALKRESAQNQGVAGAGGVEVKRKLGGGEKTVSSPTSSARVVATATSSSMDEGDDRENSIEVGAGEDNSTGGLREDHCTCCICLDGYAEAVSVRELPCGHWFHAECVDEWLDTHDDCPLCKYVVLDMRNF